MRRSDDSFHLAQLARPQAKVVLKILLLPTVLYLSGSQIWLHSRKVGGLKKFASQVSDLVVSPGHVIGTHFKI